MSWSALLTAILAAVGDWILTLFKQKQADEATKSAAVNEAAATTSQDIAETADAQAANNAVDRGSAADVARRVRERLAQKSGDGGANGSSAG